MGEVKEVPGVTEAELRATVLAEITNICCPITPVRNDEVTVADMIPEWNLSDTGVRRRLNKAVAAGTMKMRVAVVGGHFCNVYRAVT